MTKIVYLIKKFKILLVFILINNYLYSQKSIEIKLLQEQKKSISINIDSDEIYNELNKILAEAHNKAFLTARFDSIVKNKGTYNAYFYKGNKIRWGNINTGNINKNALHDLNINNYKLHLKPFNETSTINLFKKIITWYENNGYPFSSITLNNINFTENKINGTLKIKENSLYHFDKIIILGNTSINQKLLRKYINIKPNEVYNDKRLIDLEKKIQEIDFITEAKPHEIEFTKNKANIYTYLKKQKSNYFNGIIGFAPNEEEKLTINGEFNIKLSNSFKKAEKISINWKKLKSESQDFNLNFEYPYIAYTSFGINSHFTLFKKDSSYLNTNLELGLKYMIQSNNHINVFFDKRSSNIIGKNITEPNTKQMASFSSVLFGVGFFYKSFDNMINPSKGGYFNLKIKNGTKKYINNGNTPEIKSEIELKSSIYKPIYDKLTLNIRNNTALILDKNLYTNEYYIIGGINNFRGVEEHSIIASKYSIFNFELKYLFEKTSNAYIFFDYATYENKEFKELSDTPYSIGTGIDIGSRNGRFSINYALSKQFNNTINFYSGKIHLGYTNLF